MTGFINQPAKSQTMKLHDSLFHSLLAIGALTLAPSLFGLLAQDSSGTFIVRNSAFPWSDRVNVWQLADVPASVDGNGPLPQQKCGSRSITLASAANYIQLGVSNNDVEKFKTDYPTAQPTGDTLSVCHPDGSGTIPYTILKLENPPATVGVGGYQAGLILLQVGDKTGTPSSMSPPTTNSAAATPPAAPPKPAVFNPPQVPFDIGSDKTKLHIYVLMGQSNMVGRDTTGLESQTTDPRVGYFDGRNWIIAIEPMKGGSGFGPGTFFAKAMLPMYPDGKIGLVPCAVGGTPLSRWVKGADLYENAVKKAKLAAQSGTIEGMLWHQGESDANKPEDATTYEARLKQMFLDFRADIGIPDLPIVVGELGDFVKEPQVEVVKAAQKDMPNALPHVGFANSDGLTHRGDHLHFNAASQAEFGQRYAAEMQKLQQPTASK
jgi:hypothetical protein